MTFGYLPWERTPASAGDPCVRDDRLELTYGEFDHRIAAFAEQLAERGFGRGDVLAIMLPNRVELAVALFAAWRLGGAATPINPVFTAHEADHQIQD
jgi:long-chain acyl-CoA synthetase